jgi:hypothetical protein
MAGLGTAGPWFSDSSGEESVRRHPLQNVGNPPPESVADPLSITDPEHHRPVEQPATQERIR